MKIFKSLQVSIDFSTRFLIISLASWGSAPEPTTNIYFKNYLNFVINFREIFEIIFKIFQKTLNFLENFQKIINFSLIFKNFENFRVWKTLNFYFSSVKKYPPPSAKSWINYCKSLYYKFFIATFRKRLQKSYFQRTFVPKS